MKDEEKEYIDAQEESTLRSSAHNMALRSAAEHKERTIHNEAFLNELRKTDLDSSKYDWITRDRADWFSGAHAVTNRGDDWDFEADLLMQNKREREVTRRRPGRLLRDRPFMLAAMRGDDSPPVDAYERDDIPGDRTHWERKLNGTKKTDDPISSKEVSRIYGAAEVAADLMSLSRNAAGLESVSTVKTETNVRREQEDETTASRLGSMLE